MANLLKIKRGTRAQLNAAVSSNALNLGEPYLITDEGRIAVGTGSNTFADFSKVSETQPINSNLTSISNLTGAGILQKTVTGWELSTSIETDTIDTVLTRGDTTSVVPNFMGGIYAEGTIVLADPLGGATTIIPGGPIVSITLPSTTGTLALAADIPTVNNGTLSLTVGGTAAASGSAVTVQTGTGFSANSATNATYELRVGPALTALATLMNTATAGFIRRTGLNTYSVDTNTYLTGNQTISLSGDATGSGATAITVTLASVGTAGTYTKVTTDAKGRVTAGSTLVASDIPTLTASKISDFDTQVRTSRLDQMAAPTASVALNNQKITGLAEPTAASDAATKNYVDTAIQGLDPKASAKVATTSNLTATYNNGTSGVGATLTNSGTLAALALDGQTVAVGDRVLVKDQTTATQNGIYEVTNAGSGSVAWVLTRALDANLWTELPGAYIFVEQGTVNADNGFLITVDAGGTFGTTNITITQFSGAGQITAGNGLTKSGNTIDVAGTANRITVTADAVDIASTYVGQTSITTLGTIGTGTWNATAIGVTKGGTGLTAAVTGLLKGNGSAYSAAVAGTDYLDPNSTIDGGTF